MAWPLGKKDPNVKTIYGVKIGDPAPAWTQAMEDKYPTIKANQCRFVKYNTRCKSEAQSGNAYCTGHIGKI